jgi:hypothetical protein
MNPLLASSKLWVSSKFSFVLNDCCNAFVDSVAGFGARMGSGSGEYSVMGGFTISSLEGVGYRVTTATQERKMSDEPRVSDRLQYVIGTLISIVLLTGYLILSGEQEEKSAVAETNLQRVSVAKKDQEEVKQTEKE